MRLFHRFQHMREFYAILRQVQPAALLDVARGDYEHSSNVTFVILSFKICGIPVSIADACSNPISDAAHNGHLGGKSSHDPPASLYF